MMKLAIGGVHELYNVSLNTIDYSHVAIRSEYQWHIHPQTFANQFVDAQAERNERDSILTILVQVSVPYMYVQNRG